MNVLILGGNRFFGRRLTLKLVEGGHNVTLINRGNNNQDLPEKVQLISCDRTDPLALEKAVHDQSYDVVFDQICFDAPTALQACEIFQNKTPRYIFTSSKSVYTSGPNLMEKDFDPFPYHFSKTVLRDEAYDEAKRQAEATFFQKASFDVVAVRFPIVLGPDDYTERLLFHTRAAATGKPIYFPNLDLKISFIHSQDAADFLDFAKDKTFTGPINVSSPDTITLKELTQLIEKTKGRPLNLVTCPDEGEHSPFGIETHWYMNVEKVKDYGFEARKLTTWLPELTALL